MTSALLQLPLYMSKREKHQRVTAIIDQLVSLVLCRTHPYPEKFSGLQQVHNKLATHPGPHREGDV